MLNRYKWHIADNYEQTEEHHTASSQVAKDVVTKIIEAKTAGKNIFDKKETTSKFVPVGMKKQNNATIEEIVEENNNIMVEPEVAETASLEETSKMRGRPRKPVDPELANKPKRPKGRPRKPVDPELANRPKRPKGRPRKPVDPELANRPKRPKGRPRKPIDPELLNKPKLPRGRPRKQTQNI